MELPAVVRGLSGETAVKLVGREEAGRAAGCMLRTVLLRDQQGVVQAITRHQDILDIAALNERLQRHLRPMPAADVTRLCQQAGLAELAALPGIINLPVVIDSAVGGLPGVAVELQSCGQVMLLPCAHFNDLAAGADRETFAVPVESVPGDHGHSPEDDAAQLHATLKRFTLLRIRQRLDDTLELPPLPETAQRIIQLRVSPNAVLGDLTAIVESDPSLAAQVVSWASSSFYAAGSQIHSVKDAVARVLGFDLVMNLAMGLALGRALNQPDDHPEGHLGYWKQAIWQAQAAATLTRLMPAGKRPAEGLAYLTGLLHNFGYLVLAHVFPPHFKLLCRGFEVNAHLDTAVLERHFLGITRESVASQLMANWGMPDEITQAIRHQKNPRYQGEHSVYARLLWLGRQLLIARGVALGPAEVVPDACYEELGLDKTAVAAQFDELINRQDSVMAMAGLANGLPV
ncbi:HDOD domain-containing protein [Marinobacter sp. X15-166B]|uniref:HDOD domain-containing protein n=1 Tax=Marinobacter sp. X15-166B TaxID=1897620 RepID=UPI00085BEC2C|nr:HDOD domain-containing protein [Marinobacter sp. X15-166B]OEY66500.1 signal transduction protein [Marinobacter sp. X15-166B]